MTGGRSTSTQLLTVSLGAFVALVALHFACAILHPLFPVLAAVALVGAIAAAGFRWSLFRWRGW